MQSIEFAVVLGLVWKKNTTFLGQVGERQRNPKMAVEKLTISAQAWGATSIWLAIPRETLMEKNDRLTAS